MEAAAGLVEQRIGPGPAFDRTDSDTTARGPHAACSSENNPLSINSYERITGFHKGSICSDARAIGDSWIQEAEARYCDD